MLFDDSLRCAGCDVLRLSNKYSGECHTKKVRIDKVPSLTTSSEELVQKPLVGAHGTQAVVILGILITVFEVSELHEP